MWNGGLGVEALEIWDIGCIGFRVVGCRFGISVYTLTNSVYRLTKHPQKVNVLISHRPMSCLTKDIQGHAYTPCR